MNKEDEDYYVIQGFISELPENERFKVLQFAAEITEKIEKNPTLGLAIALIGAKLSKT